jgi:hypothetical protein
MDRGTAGEDPTDEQDEGRVEDGLCRQSQEHNRSSWSQHQLYHYHYHYRTVTSSFDLNFREETRQSGKHVASDMPAVVLTRYEEHFSRSQSWANLGYRTPGGGGGATLHYRIDSHDSARTVINKMSVFMPRSGRVSDFLSSNLCCMAPVRGVVEAKHSMASLCARLL